MINKEPNNDTLVKMLIKASADSYPSPLIYPLGEYEELQIQLYARLKIDITYYVNNLNAGEKFFTSSHFMDDYNFPDNVITKIIDYISKAKQIDCESARSDLIEFLKMQK